MNGAVSFKITPFQKKEEILTKLFNNLATKIIIYGEK
jgi:hypothetical protein